MAEVRRRAARTRRLSRAALEQLARPLDPDLVSERITEDGEMFRYLKGWRAIEQATAVFGHDGWGAEVVGEVAYRPAARGRPRRQRSRRHLHGNRPGHRPGLPASQRRGHGGPPGTRRQEEHAAASKAAVTDGLKRALRHFGARFGNGLGALPAGVSPVGAGAAPR